MGKLVTEVCLHCGCEYYQRRKDQRYCEEKCRKAHHQSKSRKENPVNAASSPTKRRQQMELMNSAMRHAEILYSLPVSQRLGYMKELIDLARNGNQKLRNILTNKYLLCGGSSELMNKLCRPHYVFASPYHYKDLQTGKLVYAGSDYDPKLFWRHTPEYPTITQAAELYCQRFWNASVHAVVTGQAPVPETGEIQQEPKTCFDQAA
ncbi:hypothetical protein [Ruegeria arenilitoris]|uniref:hypothetical protein n=1 Tax=Ruegeria arenilitoris TaxID=1173585 RepID=UPI001479DAFC|nr:hypothetical protein [Ruegeria arenilitoris]